jgi:phage gp29-like protein
MPKVLKAKTKTDVRQYTAEQQSIEGLVEKAVRAANQFMGSSFLDPIVKIVMESESYEEIEEKIMSTFSELYTPVELQELLARAMFVADLFGRLSAK